MAPSILIIGSNGRTGITLILAASKQTPRPDVHAFVRNPASLPSQSETLCKSVQKGDALVVDDVHAALVTTKATHIIISIGATANATGPTTVRGDSAKSITEALTKYAHSVKVIIVSSLGAGGTHIKIGFGVGMALTHLLRHVIKDHNVQEQLFQTYFDDNKKQLLIVRATGLTQNGGGAAIVLFDGQKAAPTSRVDRADVSKWIMERICENGDQFGDAINITTAKK